MTLQVIYNIAKENLGEHLTLNPSVSPEEGCAEAVAKILEMSGYDMPPGGIAGVLAFRQWLEANGFVQVICHVPGAIISSRNSDGTLAHMGICLKWGVGSNNSFTNSKGPIGTFTENYQYPEWDAAFVQNGCDILYYAPKLA